MTVTHTGGMIAAGDPNVVTQLSYNRTEIGFGSSTVGSRTTTMNLLNGIAAGTKDVLVIARLTGQRYQGNTGGYDDRWFRMTTNAGGTRSYTGGTFIIDCSDGLPGVGAVGVTMPGGTTTDTAVGTLLQTNIRAALVAGGYTTQQANCIGVTTTTSGTGTFWHLQILASTVSPRGALLNSFTLIDSPTGTLASLGLRPSQRTTGTPGSAYTNAVAQTFIVNIDALPPLTVTISANTNRPTNTLAAVITTSLRNAMTAAGFQPQLVQLCYAAPTSSTTIELVFKSLTSGVTLVDGVGSPLAQMGIPTGAVADTDAAPTFVAELGAQTIRNNMKTLGWTPVAPLTHYNSGSTQYTRAAHGFYWKRYAVTPANEIATFTYGSSWSVVGISDQSSLQVFTTRWGNVGADPVFDANPAIGFSLVGSSTTVTLDNVITSAGGLEVISAQGPLSSPAPVPAMGYIQPPSIAGLFYQPGYTHERYGETGSITAPTLTSSAGQGSVYHFTLAPNTADECHVFKGTITADTSMAGVAISYGSPMTGTSPALHGYSLQFTVRTVGAPFSPQGTNSPWPTYDLGASPAPAAFTIGAMSAGMRVDYVIRRVDGGHIDDTFTMKVTATGISPQTVLVACAPPPSLGSLILTSNRSRGVLTLGGGLSLHRLTR